MAFRGQFHVNEAATNYRYKMDLVAAHSPLHTICNSTNSFEFNWGDPINNGVKVFNINADDGTSESTTIVVTSPWFSPLTFPLASWDGTRTVSAEVDNGLLLVNAACEWIFTFSEARFYLDGVLFLTIPAKVEGGINFDLRRNRCKLISETLVGITQPTCLFLNGTFPTSGTCLGETFPTFTDTNFQVSAALEGGYQYNTGAGWTGDLIVMETVPTVSSACTCQGSHLQPYFDTDSYDQHTEALFSNIDVKTLGTLHTCLCAGVGPAYKEMQYWSHHQLYYKKECSVSSMPKTSGISSYTKTATVDCNSHIDTETTIVTGSIDTVCATTFRTDNRDSTIACKYPLHTDNCLELDEGPIPCLPDFPQQYDILCCTTTVGGISWHNPVDCNPPETGMLDIDCHPGGDWHCVVVDGSGDVTWYKDFGTTELVTTGALWADVLCLPALTFIDVLYLDGTRTRFISGGQTQTLTTNMAMTSFRNAADDRGLVLTVWQDSSGNLFANYDGGIDVSVNLLVAENFYDVVYTNGRFLLTANLVNYFSYDFGETWKTT